MSRGSSFAEATADTGTTRPTSIRATVSIRPLPGASGRQQLRPLPPGLMPRVALGRLASLHMLDASTSTTDGRELLRRRHTESDHDFALLLDRLGRTLPDHPPPKIGPARSRM